MATKCPGIRSIGVFVTAVAVAGAFGASALAASGDQKPEVQKLFQSGSYDEAVQAAQSADPASIYLASQAYLRMEQTDQSREELSKLKGAGDGWRLTAESAEALMANDGARAVDFAKQAVNADGDNPWVHYQLGLAASKQNDWGTASRALNRAIELKPDLAYAHYYAALAEQRQRQLSKAAEHFEAFLRLAPSAPERQAVQAIMRTLK